jgi:hypothetical protein
MITIEKDEFTGLKKIHTPIFNLDEFNVFSNLSVMRSLQKMRKLDFKMTHDKLSLRIQLGHNVDSEIKKLDSKNLNGFDLIYIEGEDGQGAISIRIYSMLFEDCQWPNWSDQWPMIVDGNRISLTSNHISEHPLDLEFKVYDLPVDIFSNIANATEIKYSLRGKSDKIEGALSGAYIKVFQAFEKLCFGDEKEGLTIFESLELEKNKYKGFLDKLADGDVENSSDEKKIISNEKEDEKKFIQRIVKKYLIVGQKHNATKEFEAYYNLSSTQARIQLEEKVKESMSEDEWLKWKNENKKGERNGLIFFGVIIIIIILLIKACF